MSSFAKASREKTFLRAAIMGPSGSGKSFTGMILANTLIAAGLGKKTAVIDAENGKIKKYANYVVDGQRWEFDVCVLSSYSPQDYCQKIQEAARLGYDVIFIDGISQEWSGKNGALETVDQLGGSSKFTSGWKAVTPMHNSFIETILAVPAHVICTIRQKMGYILEEVEKNGRTMSVPKRIGMEPIQRNGIEYEFEVLFDMGTDHIVRVAKTICPDMDGATAVCPKSAFFNPLVHWLSTGDDIKVDFHYGFIGAERVQAIVDRLTACAVNVDTEREWLFQNYAIRGFDQLTNDQARKYESSRLALLEEKFQSEQRHLTQKSVNAAAATNGNRTLQEILADTQTPQQTDTPNQPVQSPPTSNQQPAEYVRPANLDPDRRSSCQALFEELCFLMNVPAKQKPSVLKAAVLDRFNVQSTGELTPPQLDEIERNFVGKIRSAYAERGTPGACPF